VYHTVPADEEEGQMRNTWQKISKNQGKSRGLARIETVQDDSAVLQGGLQSTTKKFPACGK